MNFEEILDQAIAMLQRRGRMTYRTLQRQFQLDDAALRPPLAYPPYLAEQLLTSRSALEGERKQVTVLFAEWNRYWTRGSGRQEAPGARDAGLW